MAGVGTEELLIHLIHTVSLGIRGPLNCSIISVILRNSWAHLISQMAGIFSDSENNAAKRFPFLRS